MTSSAKISSHVAQCGALVATLAPVQRKESLKALPSSSGLYAVRSTCSPLEAVGVMSDPKDPRSGE